MARIPLADIANSTETEANMYKLFPANLVRALLRTTPDIAKGYLTLGKGLLLSPLSHKLREMTILRVGILSGSNYEWMQHINIANSVGVSENQIAAVRSGEYQGLNAHEATLLQFVDEVVAKPRATETFDAALAAPSGGAQNLATVTLLVGHYIMTAPFLKALAIDLDTEFTSWDNA